MDPVFIAILGTLLGGFLLKGIETVLKGNKGGAPAISSYEDRWNNKKYVAMIHKTRDAEQEAGIELSPCMCSNHKPIMHSNAKPHAINSGPAYAGMHRVEAMERQGVMRSDNGRITFHRTVPKNYEKHIDGYTFIVGTEVPKDCAVVLDFTPDTVYGVFRWMDSKGEIRYYRVPALPQLETYHVMAGDRNKPVRTIDYHRSDHRPFYSTIDQYNEQIRNATNKHILDKYYKAGTQSTGPR